MSNLNLKTITFPELDNTYEIAVQPDGNYDNLTAGTALAVLSDSYTEDAVPYKFRRTPYKSKRMLDEIVGGTVAWNQLCNGASVSVPNGHKYLSKIADAWTIGASTGAAITGLTAGADMVIDLTQMFGTTIADYIYSLETATAGAGVSLFRSLFGASYYPYNAGELISISGLSARKAVGVNAFNRSAASENKIPVHTTGALANEANSISSDYIHVLKGVPYYFSHNALVFGYDKDKTYLGCWHGTNGWVKSAGTSVTTLSIAYGSEVEYVKLAFRTATNGNKDMTKEDICVSLSASAAYEPYEEHVYPFDSALTLRGIPKLDSNNKLYFDGDRYASDGTVTRRYGLVDMGTLTWVAEGSTRFRASHQEWSSAYWPKYLGNLLCAIYKMVAVSSASQLQDGEMSVTNSEATPILRICDESKSGMTGEQFKASLSGVYLVYELRTSTTETADPYINPQYCSANGTEEYISETVVPVGHESKYIKDVISIASDIPELPTTAGSYVLKCTVTGGVPTYSWVTA